MIAIIFSLLSSVRQGFRSRAALQAEILALRHQLLVLQRSGRRHKLRLSTTDRLLWVWLSRLWSGWESALLIVKPETAIARHRRGFRLYWSWKSRHTRGRPSVSREVIDLIRKMSVANPRWGAPRIHGELLKLGFELSEATVAKYMVRHRRLPSQTWRTFLANHAKELVSSDFFVVPTAFFRVLFVFVILSHDRRPTAEWVTHQLLGAFPWDSAPRFLLRDRDGSYGEKFREAARWLGIREVLTAPQSPWQNAYAERLIGSIRRECLDHMIVLNETGLRHILKSYFEYYERTRTHLALAKDCQSADRFSQQERDESWRFRKWAACTIATSESQPDQAARIPSTLTSCRLTPVQFALLRPFQHPIAQTLAKAGTLGKQLPVEPTSDGVFGRHR